jgi:hypothetical protein
MPKYLITYHGGGEMPASPEAREQMLAAFGTWVAEVGDAMVDPGAPLAGSKTVTAEGVADGVAGGAASGYTVLHAASLDEAAALLRTHPFLKRGGSLQLSEGVDLGG